MVMQNNPVIAYDNDKGIILTFEEDTGTSQCHSFGKDFVVEFGIVLIDDYLKFVHAYNLENVNWHDWPKDMKMLLKLMCADRY